MQDFKRYILVFFMPGLIAVVGHAYAPSFSHILTAIVAFSILGLAALQASLITVQNYVLKHYPMHSFPVLRLLPPVQSMQSFLFKVLWAGFIALSLLLIGALIYFHDGIQATQYSKVIISILAWGLFATLLYGYHRSGWRNDIVTARTLIGVLLLGIAYFSSRWFEQL